METALAAGPKVQTRRVPLETIRFDDRSETLRAGKRKLFGARPFAVFRPESLQIVAFEGSERLAKVPVRLREIRAGGQVLACDEVPAEDGLIDLRGKNLPPVHIAADLCVVLESTSDRDLSVSAIVHGAELDGEIRDVSATASHMLGLSPWGSEHMVSRHEIPVGAGSTEVCWRSPWIMRPTWVRIRSDSQNDVKLVDVRVGNRSQGISSTDLPVEAFARGLRMQMETLCVAQELNFRFESKADAPRWVEIEFEGYVAEEGRGVTRGPDDVRDVREYPIGFMSPTPVGAGKTRVLSARPLVDFTGERLVVQTPEGFDILDIKVGGKSMLSFSTAIPAHMFAEGKVGVRLRMDEALIGVDLELVVHNGLAEDRPFRAALIGTGKSRNYEWAVDEIPPGVRARIMADFEKSTLFQTFCRRALQERADAVANP
jgi:hypothetical protein